MTLLYKGHVYTANTIPDFSIVWPLAEAKWDYYTAFFGDIEEANEWANDQYSTAVADLRVANDWDCWRALTIPADRDPTTHSPLGLHWSLVAKSADTYGGGTDGVFVLYRGKVAVAHIDWNNTLLARLHPTYGPDEHEVQFHVGSPIYVYDVALADGTVLPINATRQA